MANFQRVTAVSSCPLKGVEKADAMHGARYPCHRLRFQDLVNTHPYEKDLRVGPSGQERGSRGRGEGRSLPLRSDFHGGGYWVIFVSCGHPLGSPVTRARV